MLLKENETSRKKERDEGEREVQMLRYPPKGSHVSPFPKGYGTKGFLEMKADYHVATTKTKYRIHIAGDMYRVSGIPYLYMDLVSNHTTMFPVPICSFFSSYVEPRPLRLRLRLRP